MVKCRKCNEPRENRDLVNLVCDDCREEMEKEQERLDKISCIMYSPCVQTELEV